MANLKIGIGGIKMILKFKDLEIPGGGAKLVFGSHEVQNIYYGSELVYQGFLPAGTVLWEGEHRTTQYETLKIPLEKVKPGLTNISDDTSFKITISDKEYILTKQELLNGKVIYTYYNLKYKVFVIDGTNVLSKDTQIFNEVFQKVELV